MKIVCVLLAITVVFTACSSSAEVEQPPVQKVDCPSIFGVWLSYSELGELYRSEAGFESSFTKAVKNCKSLGVDTMFVHVRANADAFYPSDIFPYSNQLTVTPDYDLLSFMIDTAHQNGIAFHAWINPYRVSNTSDDYKTLHKDSPAYRWLTDDESANDSYVATGEGTLFFNPAAQEVKTLILSGITEILDHYAVDGIHFDDYFYLSTDLALDEVQYADYLSKTDNYPLSLADWRRAHVTDLMASVHALCQQKGVLFGISPAANFSYNYDTMYADVEQWLKVQAVDYIMPQIYFGYEYPDERYTFNAYLKEWKTLTQSYAPALYIGLAPYKCGSTTETEWSEHDDIVARQMKQLDSDGTVSGYVLFSYSYLYNQEEHYVNQLKCIKNARS